MQYCHNVISIWLTIGEKMMCDEKGVSRLERWLENRIEAVGMFL
jgi:hypothetical protein